MYPHSWLRANFCMQYIAFSQSKVGLQYMYMHGCSKCVLKYMYMCRFWYEKQHALPDPKSNTMFTYGTVESSRFDRRNQIVPSAVYTIPMGSEYFTSTYWCAFNRINEHCTMDEAVSIALTFLASQRLLQDSVHGLKVPPPPAGFPYLTMFILYLEIRYMYI